MIKFKVSHNNLLYILNIRKDLIYDFYKKYGFYYIFKSKTIAFKKSYVIFI